MGDIVDDLEAEGSALSRRAARYIRIKRTWIELVERMLRKTFGGRLSDNG